MPEQRQQRRWPYRAARPARVKRVVRVRDADAPRGVRRKEAPRQALHVTARQARLALAAAMLLCAISAAWWAYHSPYLTLRDVNVIGASRLTQQQVRDAAGIQGASAFTVNMRAAEARVAALPGVRRVSIEQHGRTGATITIEERTVWGSWQINETRFPIDRDGYVLDAQQAAGEGAPVILEVEPKRVLRPGDRVDASAVELAVRLVEEADTAFGRRVMALVYRETAGLTAVLSAPDIDGKPVWVTFGDAHDYEFKIASLYVLFEQAREKDLALNAVDLRFGDRLSFN